jgi:sialidase-1
MLGRLDAGTGAMAGWKCYSPSTLDPATRTAYVSGTCYCSRDAQIAAVLAATPGCPTPAPTPTPAPAMNGTAVFTGGLDGYHTYRIPVLVVATNGDLLLFAEGRKFGKSDHDWNDIVLKRSVDGGASWGPMAVVYSESTAAKHVTIGNPAPVVLRSEPGVIVLVACRENKAVLSLRSTDHGATWPAAATDVSAQAMGAEWSWVATGPPAGQQLESGRLLIAADHMVGGSAWGSHAMLSDDGGASWSLSNDMAGPGGGNECQAARAPNGSLVMNMRTKSGYRQFSWSDDNGTSWSAPTSAPMEQLQYDGGSCEGSTIALPGSDVLAFSTPYSTKARENMTVLTSTDSGATWAPKLHVDPGPSAYSSMQPINATHGTVRAAVVYCVCAGARCCSQLRSAPRALVVDWELTTPLPPPTCAPPCCLAQPTSCMKQVATAP